MLLLYLLSRNTPVPSSYFQTLLRLCISYLMSFLLLILLCFLSCYHTTSLLVLSLFQTDRLDLYNTSYSLHLHPHSTFRLFQSSFLLSLLFSKSSPRISPVLITSFSFPHLFLVCALSTICYSTNFTTNLFVCLIFISSLVPLRGLQMLI